MRHLLLVFVKSPIPGLVKTRLAHAIGHERAAALARVMAERVCARTGPPAGRYERVFFHAPADAGPSIAAWLGEGRLAAQAEGDLGARMAAAFQWAFDEGATRVVLIGTDIPELSADDVDRAFEVLDSADVALGPSLDGGYYLIGLRRPAPGLFERMPWSTPQVLPETLARAEALGLRVAPLAVRGDVDTVEDLKREAGRLREWLPAELWAALAAAVEDAGR